MYEKWVKPLSAVATKTASHKMHDLWSDPVYRAKQSTGDNREFSRGSNAIFQRRGRHDKIRGESLSTDSD